MKLLAMEIDGEAVQLTYTDGPAVPEAKQVLIARFPVQGPLDQSVFWHQLKILRAAQGAIENEVRRLLDEQTKSRTR